MDENTYYGAEHKSINLSLVQSVYVPFMNEKEEIIDYKVNVYTGKCDNTSYIFLENDRFFNICNGKSSGHAARNREYRIF